MLLSTDLQHSTFYPFPLTAWWLPFPWQVPFPWWEGPWGKFIDPLCQGMAANLLNGAVHAHKGSKSFGEGHTFTIHSSAWPTAVVFWDISLDTMKQWMSCTGSLTRTC